MANVVKDWQDKRKEYITISIICAFIGLYFYANVTDGKYIIKPSDINTYENLTISVEPKFKETKGKNGRKWIEFKCTNNKSNFEIASFDYKCVNDDEITNEIKVGDTVSIAVLNEDREDFDRETSCEIHSLIKNNKEYLDLQCRNQKDNNDGKLGYRFLFAISFLTGILYCFSEKPNFFNHVNQDLILAIVLIILFFTLI